MIPAPVRDFLVSQDAPTTNEAVLRHIGLLPLHNTSTRC